MLEDYVFIVVFERLKLPYSIDIFVVTIEPCSVQLGTAVKLEAKRREA